MTTTLPRRRRPRDVNTKRADLQQSPGGKGSTLRHSYARHLLLNGIPLNYLSRWLGHPSIQTTLIYFVKGGGKLDRADTTTSQRWQSWVQTLPPAETIYCLK